VGDSGNRTEKPTQRRLEKARKDGQFPISREIVAGTQMMIFAYLVAHYGPSAVLRFAQLSRVVFESAFQGEWTVRRIGALLQSALVPDFAMFALAGLALTAGAVAVQLLTTGFGFAASKIAPDFARLNPASRLSQIPGERIQQFLRALVMLPIVGWAVWHVMRRQVPELYGVDRSSLRSGLGKAASGMTVAIWFAASLLLLAALIDYLWQKHKHMQRLKMSKQEIRDEHKESEGNPEIKMRIRRLQRDFARRNMMKEVPTATAVIVNPTHYSVAIRYSLDAVGAPMVVAKGKNYLALRIRQRAIEHGVPIVENQPLAQALYKSADVGQEIPPHLYRAVAEVLAYIFKLMNGRGRG
jgi:flagellar biosynthetic protein FlhB